MAKQVSIVGAGVIGLSCAWRLAQNGFNVTVYHNQPLGTGASSCAAGALKPFDALQTGWKQKLQQQSLWQFPQFIADIEQESGADVGFHRCGRVAVFDQHPALEKAQKAAAKANQEWPFDTAQTVLEKDALMAYTPNAEPQTVGGIFCHATATFNPQKLLAALVGCCERRGVVFVQQKVKTLPEERPLVVAAGAFTQKLLPEVAMKPIKRQALLLEWSSSHTLRHIIENGQVYLVPWQLPGGVPGHAVYVGSTFEPEAGFDTTTTVEAEQKLRHHTTRLFPELQNAKCLKRLCGLQSRGAGAGSTLKLGPVPDHKDVFVAAGHGGVGYCMAPITAAEIQRLIEIRRLHHE